MVRASLLQAAKGTVSVIICAPKTAGFSCRFSRESLPPEGRRRFETLSEGVPAWAGSCRPGPGRLWSIPGAFGGRRERGSPAGSIFGRLDLHAHVKTGLEPGCPCRDAPLPLTRSAGSSPKTSYRLSGCSGEITSHRLVIEIGCRFVFTVRMDPAS